MTALADINVTWTNTNKHKTYKKRIYKYIKRKHTSRSNVKKTSDTKFGYESQHDCSA